MLSDLIVIFYYLYSQMFKTIFQEISFDQNPYKILVPDIEYSDVEALCHILYGVDVAVPRSRFDKIHILADMLGIPVEKLKKPEDFLLDPNEPRLAASNGVKFCHVYNSFESPKLW